MSDLGLARHAGQAALPATVALAARPDAEQGAPHAAGVHLVAVQSADGAPVVGDSRVHAATLDPFGEARADDLIPEARDAVQDFGPHALTGRRRRTYASARAPGVRTVVVTAGCGAAAAFASPRRASQSSPDKETRA